MTDQSPAPPPCEVIILTALPEEFRAVEAHLQGMQEVVHPETGTIYQQGTFPGKQGTWHVAVAQIGMGGLSAASETERASNLFHPRVMLFVGIAGGLKDVRHGDVVVATKVYAYESGKAEAQFKPRPELWHASYALKERAKAEANNDEWLARLNGQRPHPAPRILLGPLAAGEKVLSDQQSSVYGFLQTAYGDALAVEMEGHGFLQALHANQHIYALVIRGISDQVADKAAADAVGWQEVAARHAAAFAFQVLAKFTLPASHDASSPLLTIMEGTLAEHSSLLAEIQTTLNHLVRPEGDIAALLYTHGRPILDIPPPVDKRSERTETVQQLLVASHTHVWVALSGSTGCGKTQLAILLVSAFNTRCIWLSLRGLAVAEAGQKLDAACEAVTSTPAPQGRGYWYRNVCAVLGPGSGIILDDLPRCTGNDELATRLVLLVQACAGAGVHLITTSAHAVPSQVKATLKEVSLYELPMPLFSAAEAADLFLAYGAPALVLQPRMVGFLNGVAQQHPTLLVAMARYLETRDWQISDETFEALIRGQFASAMLDEIMGQVLATVTDAQSCELLYRLTLNRHASSFEDVLALAQVNPMIERPRERLYTLSGLWVQREAGDHYEVSPLVSALGMTELAPVTTQACHSALGSRIVAQHRMTPPQLIEAMAHFNQAAEYDRSGALLAFALTELKELNTRVPDFGLLSAWTDQTLPSGMSLGLRLHVRGLQIAGRHHRGLEIDALIADLDTLLAQATGQEAWAVISIVILTTSVVKPPHALHYLRTALRLAPHGRMPNGHPLIFPEKLTFEDLIWAQVPFIVTTDHLHDWIQTLEQMTPEQLSHACADDFAEKGSIALAEQLWLRELDHPPQERNWQQVLDLLDELASRAHAIGAELLWGCAIRARIAVCAEYRQDMEGAVRDAEAALVEATSDPRVQLLIRECVGRQYLYAGQGHQAVQWLQEALSHQISAYPRVRMVALLSVSQALVSEDTTASKSYAQQAVDLSRSTEEIHETDVVRALGELAIVEWLAGDLNATFSSWDAAGEYLFACRTETDLWKDLCVIYGHISGYFTSVATQGQPPEVGLGGEPYVAPLPGMLLAVQMNRAPLYDARKDVYLASQLATFAGAVGQDARAAVWAKRGLEWARQSRQWLALPTLSVHLLSQLICADQYSDALESALESGAMHTALDMLSSQEQDLSGFTGEVGGILGEKPSAIWDRAEYLAAILGLLPIAFRLAWLSLHDTKQAEHHANEVSELCREVETSASDKALWRTAAELFQAAFVRQVSADELMRQTEAINADTHQVLRAIGFLCASLAVKGALELAYQMHKSLLSFITGMLRLEPEAQRQVVTPFLVEFWTQRFVTKRFRFRAPTVVEAELVRARSLPENQKAQAVLNAIALGLG